MADPESRADRWLKVQTIFRRAAELPIADRDAFLSGECGDDEQLLFEVQGLLMSDVDLQNDTQDFIADAVAGGESLIGVAETEQPLPTRFGKYEVESKLGSGGFGVVYQGRDPTLRRSVAIKVCSSPDEEIQKRFYREGRIAAGLRHPNITTVFEMSVEGGVPFMVQELLHGEDLEQILKAGRGLGFGQVVGYLLQTARGLQHAHGAGVLHRDIKPANIRILPDDSVKLMDFGIAKLLGAETGLTVDGTTLGTVGYLAPEQLRSEPVDERADIFSFGVVAYELLTGDRPFRGKDFSQVSYQLLYEDPVPILDRWQACPIRLARLVHQCLAKQPINRPGSFAPVLRELEQLEKKALDHALAIRSSSGGSESSSMAADAPQTTPWTGTSWLGSETFGGSTSWARIRPRDFRSPLMVLSLVLLTALGGAFFWWGGGGASPDDSRGAEEPARTIVAETPGLSRGTESSETPGLPQAATPQPGTPQPTTSFSAGPLPPAPLPTDSSAADPSAADPSAADPSAAASLPEKTLIETPLTGATADPETSSLPGLSNIASDPPVAAAERESALEDHKAAELNPGAAATENLESSSDSGDGAPLSDLSPEAREHEPSSVEIATPPAVAPETVTPETVAPETVTPKIVAPKTMAPGDLITAEGPGVELPSLVSLPEPSYPRRARRRGIEGRIVVKVLVDENGKVLQAIAPGRDEHGFLAAAREAARGARFEPATRDGIVGRMWTHLPVEFSLGSNP